VRLQPATYPQTWTAGGGRDAARDRILPGVQTIVVLVDAAVVWYGSGCMKGCAWLFNFFWVDMGYGKED